MKGIKDEKLLEKWLVGRKAICAHTSLNWLACKRCIREAGMPVSYLPTGSPATLPILLNYWLAERIEKGGKP